MILDIVRDLKSAAAASDFHDGADQLLNTLGYSSRRRGPDVFSPEAFVQEFKNKHSNRPENAPPTQTETRFIEQVKSLRLLFQIGDGEVNEAVQKQVSQTNTLFDSSGRFGDEIDRNLDKSFLFASVELEDETYPRGKYAEFTRELNKRLPVATVALFRTRNRRVSIALADRRFRENEPEGRAVLGRVSLLREINPERMRSDATILERLTLKNRIEWMQERAKNDEKRNFDGLRKAWLDTLDTESLNKRFYKDLKAWFDRVVEEAKFPTETQTQQEHAVRLITRMLFIWFMKEKGLVNKNLFNPKQVAPLMRNWNIVSGDSYYQAVLQNLFFATLNTRIDQRDFSRGDRSTHRVPNLYRYADLMTDPTALMELFAETPFINGGLFESLDDLEGINAGGKRVDCFTDNPHQRKQLSVSDNLFFDEESGLFKLFERYKFTVEENTPIEQEVALDPELLGKVFENLLAEMNPETSETALKIRKKTGSYYTPRAVVNYMTKEALAAALVQRFKPDDENTGDYWRDNLDVLLDDEEEWDEAGKLFSPTEKRRLAEGIADLKILDPAVGSGAFPMTALLKLTMALRRIDPHNELWREVLLKRAGNQAEQVISQERDKKRYQKQMEVIKATFDKYDNLDSDYGRKLFLIQNNIFGVDIQRIACQIAKLRFFITLAIEQESKGESDDNFGFEPLPNLETRFVAADALLPLHPPDSERPLRSERTDQLEQEIHGNRQQYFPVNERDEKRRLKRENKRLRRELSEQLKKLKWSVEAAERIANWDSFSQTDDPADWFDPEYMFGVRNGFDVVIGNPPYVQLQKNRGELANRYQDAGFETFARTGDIYCLFYEQALNLATEGGCACFITSNKWMRSDYGKKLRDLFVEKTRPRLLVDMGPGVFEASVDTNILLLSNASPLPNAVMKSVEMKPDFNRQQGGVGEYVRKNSVEMPVPDAGVPWTIASTVELNILKKMRNVGTPLKEWGVNINRGITTGCNDAFIIDTVTRDAFIEENPNSYHMIKPIVMGKNINKWQLEWADKWLLYVPWHFPLHLDSSINGSSERAERELKAQYPGIYRHLVSYKSKLEARNQSETGIRYEWYALQRWASKYYEDFEKEKVIWNDIATSSNFAYIDMPMFCNNTGYIMTGEQLKYLCGVLNSRLITWFMRNAAAGLGQKAIRWIATYINRLPIPRPTPAQEAPLVHLVDEILSAKSSDASANVSAEEAEIDERVCALYGLTKEERAVVSGG